MSTNANTNQVADAEGDIEVIDLPETDFTILPKDNQISKIDQGSGYWGDMSKYTNEDFDHLIPRLIVPSLVAFVKSANTQAPLAKLVIQNTSNLPMTYNVQDFHVRVFPFLFQTQNPKIRVTKPEPGWIPPKSSALLNIGIDVEDDSLHVLKHFALHAVPIFREEHTRKENLELIWKAFDSECFPRSHAEEHVFTLYTSSNPLNDHINFFSLEKLLLLKSPKNFRNDQEQISDEEFNALWVAGEDPKEYKFALELRVCELNRVMKRTEVEAGVKLKKEKNKWFLISFFIIFLVTCGFCVVLLEIVEIAKRKSSKNDDDLFGILKLGNSISKMK